MTGLDVPSDYSRAFWLEGPVGNNAFACDRRGPAPRLYVPSLIEGTLADVQPGHEVVFEDIDEHGTLHSCTGLAHFVRTTWRNVPTIIVDNHNHALYFWHEALNSGRLTPGAALIHLDQHRDMRVPGRLLSPAASLPDVFHYANFDLNVGNYIVPAQHAGLVGDTLFATGSDALDARHLARRTNSILNIDLDFFAPEMAYISFERTWRFIDAHLQSAALVTIATSPFFIDQSRAIEYLRRLMTT
jgi:hypothetical protein